MNEPESIYTPVNQLRMQLEEMQEQVDRLKDQVDALLRRHGVVETAAGYRRICAQNLNELLKAKE